MQPSKRGCAGLSLLRRNVDSATQQPGNGSGVVRNLVAHQRKFMLSLQTMLGDTAKANHLFARLAETTPGAMKTRAALLGELKVELDAHAELEQAHLLPILRKHPETKELAKAAAERLRAVRELLVHIGREPLEGDSFVGRVKELKKVFQAHLRDDKSELLPAVKKALTDDEATAVAEGISTAKTAAETAQKEAAEARRADTRRLRDEAEARDAAVVAAKQASRKAATDAARLAHSAAEAGRIQPENTRETINSGLRAADELTRQVATGVAKASSGITRTMTRVVEQAPTVPIAVQGLQGVSREWINWVQTRAQNQAEGFASLARCRTPFELFAAQARLLQEDIALLIESGARIHQIAGRLAPQPS